MLEQLNRARHNLETALDDYLQTFQTIRSLYVDEQPINTVPSDLASILAEQLPIIDSFKDKLNLAKRFAGRSMNASSSLVPLHALPPEILTYIFRAALDMCPYHHSDYSWYQSFQNIKNVCSYWCQVAFNSPGLWTHVDLIFYNNSHNGDRRIQYFDLAKSYAARSAHTLLDVHIIDETSDTCLEHHTTCASLIPFLISIAPRIKSLTFEVYALEPHRLILAALFNNCVPGNLKTLVTRMDSEETYYLQAGTNPAGATTKFMVDVPERRLNDLYLGITTLQLGSLYPRWDSSAYHGLTELRLKGGSSHRVTEGQLMNALRHSPRLRVVECTIYVVCPLNNNEMVDPIALNDLEVLNLGHSVSFGVETILRWLAPGSKSLQLLMNEAYHNKVPVWSFFGRSIITKLYLRQSKLTNVIDYVHHLPHLHTMVLAYSCGARKPPQPQYSHSEDVKSSLETLYVIGHSCHHLMLLQDVISLKSLRRVVFSRCALPPPEEVLLTVSSLNSEVECIIAPEYESNPVGQWDLFSPKKYSQNDHRIDLW